VLKCSDISNNECGFYSKCEINKTTNKCEPKVNKSPPNAPIVNNAPLLSTNVNCNNITNIEQCNKANQCNWNDYHDICKVNKCKQIYTQYNCNNNDQCKWDGNDTKCYDISFINCEN
jgi:hypothetical protein